MTSLVDQSVVSGTRFAVAIVVARACGVTELGTYALGMSMIMLGIVSVQALVMTPYTNYLHRAEYRGRTQQLRGTSLILATLILALLALVASLMSLGFGLSGSAPTQVTLIAASAVMIPIGLLEVIRRFGYADHQTSAVLRLDVAACSITLASMMCCWWLWGLTAARALLLVGAANLLVVLPSWWRLRSAIEFASVSELTGQLLSFGKWVFASEFALYVKNYANTWLLYAFCGLTGAGIYAACVSLMRASNPVILGIANIAEPRLATAFAQRGREDVQRVTLWLSVALVLAVMPIVATLMLASYWLLLATYGIEYAAYWAVVVILSAATLISAASYPFGNALQAIHRPELAFRVRVATLGVGIAMALWLIPGYGIVGAAVVMLASSLMSLILRLLEFHRIFVRGRRLDSPEAEEAP